MKHVNRNKPLDPYTFGNSVAAVNLASMLSTDVGNGSRSAILRIITKYQSRFKQATEIDNLEFGTEVLQLLYEKSIKVINARKESPEIISHTRNVLQTSYKIYMERLNVFKKVNLLWNRKNKELK